MPHTFPVGDALHLLWGGQSCPQPPFSHLSCSVKKNLQKVFAWGTSGVGLPWGRNGIEGGGYRRSVTPEAGDVAGVVIWHAVVPAAECDADPLECERPDGGMMVVALLSLLLVEDASPVAESDGMARPLMKGLPKELGAGAAKMHRFRLSAPLHHGGDAAEFLHLGGGGVAFAARAESRQQPRR